MIYELKKWVSSSFPVIYDADNWTINVMLTVIIQNDLKGFEQNLEIGIIIPNQDTFGVAAQTIQNQSVAYVNENYNTP